MNPDRSYREIPSTDLYIYYLKGHINQHAAFFGDTFLGNWEEDGFSFLFFSSPSGEEVEKLLQVEPDVTLIDRYHMSYEDWIGGPLKPFQVGRFYIHPPWLPPVQPDETDCSVIDIVLDPGVVFGTGQHATTHDCLEAMVLAFSQGSIKTAIDLGTGTGLLAVAAAKLGCESVLAVDLNHLAVQSAVKNIKLNQVDKKVLGIRSSAEYFLDNNTDLVIANIHYDVMNRLLVSKKFLGKNFFVLSGLLRSQARDVDDKLATYQATILKKWEHDGIWYTYLGSVC